MDCDAFRNDMLDVLYGEGGEAPARRLESHQAACADCRRELAALRRLRGDLAQWRLPESLQPEARRAHARPFPVGLAAAAALALALGTGLALGGVEVRHDGQGFSVRVGRAGDAGGLAAAEQRHQEELAALRAEVASLRSRDDRTVLASVAAMIRESEQRQDAARETSVRELRERSDAQRRYDLARVSAGLAYVDGRAGLQAARTTELVGHVLQASQQR
jgi:hypothetical protein